VAACGTA